MDFHTYMLAFERNLSALDMTLTDLASFVTFGAPAKPTDEQIDHDARECVEGRAGTVGGTAIELARVA